MNKIKETNQLPKIIIMSEGMFTLRACSSIPPDKADTILDEVPPSGTSCGWKFPDYEKYPIAQPIKCEDHEDRWHYILEC
jgi:hypothetical protein